MIARQGSGARETFTVRKQSFGVGVERTFPVHSPKIERLEVVARGDVRRAKLYYLRGRVGKRARVAERRWGIEDDLVIAEEPSPRRSTPRASPRSEAESMPAEAPRTRRRPRRPKPSESAEERPRRREEAAEATTEAEAAEPRTPRPRRGRGLRGTPADPEADNAGAARSSSWS